MNPLHIYFVLDRSGSMESIRTDVIGGFNTFLHEQKALPDPARMTVVQFDSQDVHEVTVAGDDITNIKELDVSTFVPRGGTPLYDAIGQAITMATARQEARIELAGAPEDIVFVIFTDGGENASSNYTKEKAFNLIKKKEGDGWKFVYMGANQDSYDEAGSIGMTMGNTSNYKGDSRGTKAAFLSLSSNMTHTRNLHAGGQSLDSFDFYATKEAEEDAPDGVS